MTEFDALCLLHPYNQLLGTNLVTCPFENYRLSMRCSPIKVTHPKARFCDSAGDSLMVTLPQPPPHPHSPHSLHASCSLFWLRFSLGFTHALKSRWPLFSCSPVSQKCISNQCDCMSMLKTARFITNQFFDICFFTEKSEVIGSWVKVQKQNKKWTQIFSVIFFFLTEYKLWKAAVLQSKGQTNIILIN